MTKEQRKHPAGPDGAKLVRTATFVSMAKTDKGYATILLKLRVDGTIESIDFGRSQAVVEFEAINQKRAVMRANSEVQR